MFQENTDWVMRGSNGSRQIHPSMKVQDGQKITPTFQRADLEAWVKDEDLEQVANCARWAIAELCTLQVDRNYWREKAQKSPQ